MRESVIEAYLVKKVKEVGGWPLKFQSSLEAGLPDRIVIFPNGWIVWVELKAPGKKPRPLQRAQIKRLRIMNQKVVVIDTKHKVDMFIRWYHVKRYYANDGS